MGEERDTDCADDDDEDLIRAAESMHCIPAHAASAPSPRVGHVLQSPDCPTDLFSLSFNCPPFIIFLPLFPVALSMNM